ncbi:MAG: hypothetical protein O7E52_26255, partial [Candidatus Poribacteria bacterium]|nr:hypothetical protein [Candidatus Poribacteria bacterium]
MAKWYNFLCTVGMQGAFSEFVLGLAEHAVVWTRNNPILIEAAIDAVKRYQPKRVTVSVPERP